MTEEQHELRKEHNKRVIDGVYKVALGCTCVNCGSTEDIEYHHIVPICVGGTNKMSNIVPVCRICHISIHTETEYRKAAGANAVKKPKAKKNDYQEDIMEYATCKIGMRELKERMSRKGPLSKSKQYKYFLEKHRIEKIENFVDRFQKRGLWPPRRDMAIGYVFYINGDSAIIYYEDTKQ